MKLAQSILAEKEEVVRKKEKKAPLYGLTPTERRKQFGKDRDKNSQGYERKSEVDMSKTQSVIKMISRAVKRGLVFDYVLFDSWFFSKGVDISPLVKGETMKKWLPALSGKLIGSLGLVILMHNQKK